MMPVLPNAKECGLSGEAGATASWECQRRWMKLLVTWRHGKIAQGMG